MTAFETILLDVDAATRVATITLNRPDALNSFNRTMCEEMAGAWRIVKLDESVNAVVLRAAGDRAFSAGLDITTPYGQPDNVWNHEDPGEALSPKWQKMWKPVVCAVQGLCTAGAFYFVNEADVVICSTDATFFDSHVSAGLVCALEPIGLMRRIGLGETLRIALMGNDERVSADTALRIGLVSEVVPRDRLWARAHEIASAIAAKPPSATQGTVKAIWESLDKPYRAAMEQNLIYTRLGNPLGRAELAARGGAELAARGGAELAARGEGGAAEPRIR
jgi:enoyl-CoA hydratase/carnithine racemase